MNRGANKISEANGGTASNWEKQLTSDARRLVRPELAPHGAQHKRPHTSIAKLYERSTMRVTMHRFYRAGTLRNRDVLSKARAV